MQSINGPLLVFLSVALTIVSVATVCLARHRVWQASGAAGPDPRDPPELDDYELAYLNGGAALAATAAAVVLLRAGHLAGTEPAERHLSQEVHLRPGTPPASPHPVEQAVFELVAALQTRLRGLGLALTQREMNGYGATVLWFLPLLALAVARVVAVPSESYDVFPVVTMTILVAIVITLAGGFLTYLPAVATPYGRRVLTAQRAGTPPPGRAILDRGASATAGLRRSVALHGTTVLRVADLAMAVTLKVPDWSTSSAEAAGGTEFTGVSG